MTGVQTCALPIFLKLELTNHVFLPGSVPEAHQYLKTFDLFVLPSVKEGLPYAMLKAQVAQIPIVATKVGANAEILASEQLVKPADPELLAQKIKKALKSGPQIISVNIPPWEKFLQETIKLYLN